MKKFLEKPIKAGLLAVTLLLVFALASPAVAQQNQAAKQPNFPIAVVDVGRVFRESKQGQAIDQQLRKEGQDLEKTMQAKDAELKKAYEALIKDAQSGKTTREALETKEKALQKQIQDFQAERAKAMDAMNRKAEDTLKPLQDKTETAIEALAKSNGFVVVLNSAGVVYAPNSIDITTRVIEEVDKAK